MIKQISGIVGIALIILLAYQYNNYDNNYGNNYGNNYYRYQNQKNNRRENQLILLTEQPLENAQTNSQYQKPKKYDLNENLTFDLKSLHQYVQVNENKDQILPFMVSVKTQDQMLENNDIEQFNQRRPGIDLVCVIDNSGSMGGDKINQVQNTLKYLLDYMNEYDRISLITFNSYSTILTSLIKTNESSKSLLIQEINNIYANGGTHISDGIQQAFNILLKRKYKNPITSIFLLSDGQDNESKISVQDLLNQEQYHSLRNEQFTINSFGYGSDHDSKLMSQISDLRDGNFYYVKDLEKIDEFFADAFGGLISVIAENITINVNINKNDPLFEKYFSSSYISKTYGDFWKEIKKGEQYQIKINQLISGVSKDFVFEITIPQSKLQYSGESGINVNILNADLKALNIENKDFILKKTQQSLLVFGKSEQIPDYLQQKNLDVEFNLYRVQVSEAVKESMNYADEGKYKEAQDTIKTMDERFSHASPENQERLKSIKKDFLSNIDNVSEQNYQSGGRHSSTAYSSSNYRQSSQVMGDSMYSNTIQREYVQKQKTRKYGGY